MLRSTTTWLLLLGAAAAVEVPELDGQSFDAYLEEHPMFMTMFYAPWCGHCRQFGPEYEKAAAALSESQIHLVKVDASDKKNMQLVEKFEVQGFPSLKLIRNGKGTNYGG